MPYDFQKETKRRVNVFDLLGLVEVVGSSVVDIVAESGSHHGKGI